VVGGDRQGQHFDNRDTGLSSPGIEPYSEIDDIAAVMPPAWSLPYWSASRTEHDARSASHTATRTGSAELSPQVARSATSRIQVRMKLRHGGRCRATSQPRTRMGQWRALCGGHARHRHVVSRIEPHDRRRMIGLTVANDYLVHPGQRPLLRPRTRPACQDPIQREHSPPQRSRWRARLGKHSALCPTDRQRGTDATLTVLAEAAHVSYQQRQRFLSYPGDCLGS
jgi:hypothetical protein